MFVVDRHALQPVDILDLVNQVGREFLDAIDGKNVVRGRVSIEQILALLNAIAFLNRKLLAFRQQIFLRFLVFILRYDRNTTLVLVVAPELDRSLRSLQ